MARARQYVALFVIGWFGTQTAIAVIRILEGGARPVYIDSWLFLLLLLGSALSVSGLLIGAGALVVLWIRRSPRRRAVPRPQVSGIVNKDGRPL